MISQTDILIGLVLMVAGFLFGMTRAGRAFGILATAVFLFNLCYSYWTLKEYIYWLSWNGQIIEAVDVTMNWFVYWLLKAIMASLPLGVGYFVGLALPKFENEYYGRVV